MFTPERAERSLCLKKPQPYHTGFPWPHSEVSILPIGSPTGVFPGHLSPAEQWPLHTNLPSFSEPLFWFLHTCITLIPIPSSDGAYVSNLPMSNSSIISFLLQSTNVTPYSFPSPLTLNYLPCYLHLFPACILRPHHCTHSGTVLPT